MSSAIITRLEPPCLPDAADVAEDSPIEIHVELVEPDCTRRTASAMLASDTSDEALADSLVRCLRGLAEMRGPGLRTAIQRLVTNR